MKITRDLTKQELADVLNVLTAAVGDQQERLEAAEKDIGQTLAILQGLSQFNNGMLDLNRKLLGLIVELAKSVGDQALEVEALKFCRDLDELAGGKVN